MIKGLTKVLLLTFIFLLAFATNNFATLGIEDKVSSYIVGDSASGQIFAKSGEDKILPIASISKLMTYMVVEDAISKGEIKETDKFTIEKVVAETEGSSMNLQAEESISVKDLIDGLIIVSGNDAAVALSHIVAGDQGKFVELMNNKAKEIGLTSATFYNASGLQANGNQNKMSSADLFKMTVYLLDHYPKILEIANKTVLDQPERQVKKQSTVPFLGGPMGVDGLKTGTTHEAGWCLISTMKGSGSQGKEEFRTIGIVMGASDGQLRNDYMKVLLDYVIKNYSVKTIVDPNKAYDTVKVSSIEEGVVEVYPSEELKMLLNKEKGIVYTPEYIDINAPLKSGDKVGELLVEPGGDAVRKIDLIVKNDYRQAGLGTRVYRAAKNVFSTFKNMLYF